MTKLPSKIRLLAAFLVVFVCLNAGGAVCVGFCQSFDLAVNESEHSSLKKAVHHCEKASQTEGELASGNLSSSELDCCPMTVSFFAAPVAKHFISFTKASQHAVQPPHFLPLAFRAASFAAVPHYRGPPLLDRRGLRIKHRILRI